ncbi:hypothetical protein O1611_g10442 [Lasiodiplodia mahajangana]|uniref:Uncharacterized protein n=1 Tax=Lasiodiplodia mahajangana TaxID=1108764 RepID=A0ACC2IY81_9PEZI|nr:hypothetical protein O1611_g10442 [Lasiodiplodia mahajangana]
MRIGISRQFGGGGGGIGIGCYKSFTGGCYTTELDARIYMVNSKRATLWAALWTYASPNGGASYAPAAEAIMAPNISEAA